MRKLLAAMALLGALVAVQVTPAQAAVTTNTTIPSAFTFFDACTNEPVAVSGDIHFLTTSTVTDNTISGVMHTLFKATGTGLVFGMQYQEEVAFVRAFSSSLQDGQSTVTTNGEINLVAPGGANNLWSPIFFHSTFDANGNLTSSRVDFPAPSCH